VIAIVLIMAVTLLLPKKYTAIASVVLDIKSPDPIAGMVLQGVASPSYLLTQVDVITSDRVAGQVVRQLDPAMLAEWKDIWKDEADEGVSFESWAVDRLQKTLDVRPSRGSNVINVSFATTDPKYAALTADAFVNAYLTVAQELRTEPAKQYNRFFDDNAKLLRDKVEAAQARLATFQRENNVLLVTDDRFDAETTRLNELSLQSVTVQSAAADSSSRAAEARQQGDRLQEVVTNPLIASLKSELSRQESDLQNVSNRLGSQHPDVIARRASIADLRARVASETARVASSVGVNNSVNQSRSGSLRAALEEQRAKVLKLKSGRDQAAVLQRDVDAAQRAYEAVLTRLSVTNLESQGGIQSSVSRLEQASLPIKPSSPRILINLLMAIVVGCLCALGTAVIRELRDRRLRTIEEIEPTFQQPLIGVLPSYRKRQGPASPFATRLLAGVPSRKAIPSKT